MFSPFDLLFRKARAGGEPVSSRSLALCARVRAARAPIKRTQWKNERPLATSGSVLTELHISNPLRKIQTDTLEKPTDPVLTRLAPIPVCSLALSLFAQASDGLEFDVT